eukprot:4934765-Prymnesium_polylepis.2
MAWRTHGHGCGARTHTFTYTHGRAHPREPCVCPRGSRRRRPEPDGAPPGSGITPVETWVEPLPESTINVDTRHARPSESPRGRGGR